jgi:AcrR family transcriptional regulator
MFTKIKGMVSEIHGPSDTEPLSPERRARILAGAGEIFISAGYEGASMSQIAAQSNVSKGTLYNYFPSKAALFAAFVRDDCAKFVASVFESPPQEDLRSELTRIGLTMLSSMLSPRGMDLFRVVVMEAAKFPDLAMEFMKAGPEVLVANMADWLRDQMAAGRLNVADPVFAAEQFFSLTQARLVYRSRIMPSYRATAGEIERVVDGAVTVFLAAYGVSDPF